MRSLRYKGVKLFNSIHTPNKTWTGSSEGFKEGLNHWLALLPDQPETETLIPEVRDYSGNPSNYVTDWAWKLSIDF